jgi:hypothetical protein
MKRIKFDGDVGVPEILDLDLRFYHREQDGREVLVLPNGEEIPPGATIAVEKDGTMRRWKATEALPVPDAEGVRFGPNLWISWDRLAGWEGDDRGRDTFYANNVFARGLMEWRESLLAAHAELTVGFKG